MEAKRTGLLQFLQEPKQLILSDNENPYRWTEEQCRQLWDDILRLAQDDSIPEHYFGSIMILEKGLFCTYEIPKLVLINGQKRLVTISLLLAALGKVADKDESRKSEITHKKIYDYYFTNNLLNKDEDSEALYYKLVLSSRDNRTYVRLIEGNENLPVASAHPLVKIYRFFEKKIRESGISPDVIYKGIGKLTVVDISTDRYYDNPQFVLENLMATGLTEVQSKLIMKWLACLYSVSLLPEKNPVRR